MVDSGRIFNILLFASADKIAEFGPDKLAEMGCFLVWIGRESKFADYGKNRGLDLKELIAELRRHGVKTILSSILLTEEHTKKNIEEDIQDHLDHNPVFSQFSHLSPLPGTPLYDRLDEEGRIYHSIPHEEWHAFKQPWFKHPEFSLLEAEKVQERAYLRDYHELGPSVYRWMEADLIAWEHMRNTSSAALGNRAEDLARNMYKFKVLAPAVEYLAPNERVRELTRDLRSRLEKSFGPSSVAQIAAARMLQAAGTMRRARNRRWGDAIQPRTMVTRYNQ